MASLSWQDLTGLLKQSGLDAPGPAPKPGARLVFSGGLYAGRTFRQAIKQGITH